MPASALGGGGKPLVSVLRQFRKGGDCEIQNHESGQSRTIAVSYGSTFHQKGEHVVAEIVKEAICYFLISCLPKLVSFVQSLDFTFCK